MDLLRRVPTLIGPALLIFIFYRYIDPGQIAQVYAHSAAGLLFTSCFFNTLLLVGKIHRLYFMLNKSAIQVGFFATARTFATSNLMGQISNVLVSDVVNAGALMLHREKKARISSIFVVARFADLLSITGMLCVCLFLNAGLLKSHLVVNARPLWALSALLLVVSPCALIFRRKILYLCRDLRQTIGELLPAVLAYSLGIYLCYSLSALFDARSLHLQMPMSYILLMYTMGSLITVVPISVAGIGTRDILFIFLLKLVAISAGSAVALSSLGFLIMPSVSLVIIYLLSLIGIRYENRRHGRCGE